MPNALRLLCVLAHPDDESLGTGGILAKYASEGIETYLVTATRGELGWFGEEAENPGQEALGRIREEELRCAAGVLGLRDVALLDYHDGELDKADPTEAIAKIVAHVRRVRPHVIVTFDQNGIYGHPDHIAACQFTTAAVVAAADAGYSDPSGQPPHGVSKLYYAVWRREVLEAYEAAFGELVMHIDGVERRSVTWPEWAITTTVDTGDHWQTVWEAIRCHRSQLPGYQKLLDLSEEHHRNLWGSLTYCRVFSLVDAPAREDDLFAGLR
ncbi:MAG: PIG-L deacetylase family protein [Dehalococcoidia bacterium]